MQGAAQPGFRLSRLFSELAYLCFLFATDLRWLGRGLWGCRSSFGKTDMHRSIRAH